MLPNIHGLKSKVEYIFTYLTKKNTINYQRETQSDKSEKQNKRVINILNLLKIQ